MNSDTPLYVIVDERGVKLAYPTMTEAEESLTSDLPTQAIRPTTFGQLLKTDRHALVHVQLQYYWAEDLA